MDHHEDVPIATEAMEDEADQEATSQDKNTAAAGKNAKRFRTVDEVIDFWEQQLKNETLSSHHFREWWRMQVPKLFSPSPSMDTLYPLSHVDDKEIHDLLIAPLERFLCCDSDTEKVFKQLAEKNDPPAVCGKLFKVGEPTYSCRDCGLDLTCVLCVDCFKNSDHQNHRWKISTSNGGGYCDCGDPEAWTQHVYCAVHQQGAATGQADTNDLINRLPENIRTRARHVLASVLDYVFDTLTTEILLKLSPDLTYKEELSDFGMESNDDYVTVIYNDEYHRFEEVMTTISTVLECDRTKAIGLTTMIDRNGRCIVKCSGFQDCQEVKKQAERKSRMGGKPLKISIMHSHVVAHQNHAEKLITWLQSIMETSTSFRALLGSMLLEYPGAPSTIGKNSRLDNFLRNDIILWKAARSSVHHFLIQAMLHGPDANRRAFAATFTKNYCTMMKDFINDDHDHSFSVTSLSVQLFTVPTLAHYLIANHDVLPNLFRTFMSECERKRNDRGKLEFLRHLSNQSYQRAYYVLFDIKYLLMTTPDDPVCKTGWTDTLRKGFLRGLNNLLDIFSWMQGMDLQLRQTNQHIDHEFEWEPYFRLYIQFINIIALVTKWCSTDNVVFIKAMRMLFKKLFEDQKNSGEEFITRTIGDVSATCIDYQVSSKPVALHQPLTRLLSALSLYMDNFELSFDSNELDIMERPTAVQMMEPSLRTVVFVSQVQAGMWRRNGHSLTDQVNTYHEHRWRREMADRDIIMLQLAAANMHPDDFMINLVSKFQLINWSSQEFDFKEDDSIRQINILAEEFLSILVYILAERYIPQVGEVTQEDCTRNEIIQLLCIAPMAHSALCKSTEDFHLRENGLLDKVVESVATFKRAYKGSVSANGKYELRPEFYPEYNVFFYRYTRESQSKAEEAQRHRKKAASEPEITPPPQLPKFTKQFMPVLRVLHCDVFLHLLSLILDRADNLRSRCFSENQVQKALHLIGICLQEEEKYPDLIQFSKNASQDKFALYDKLQKLVGSQRIESHKDFLHWVISTWQRVAGIKEDDSKKNDGNHSSSMDMDIKESEDKIQEDKEAERKRLAAERRKKVMDQMKNAQKNFMKENKQLFDDTVQKRVRLDTSNEDSNEAKIPDEDKVRVQCLGPDRASPVTTDERFHTCILCQDEEELKAEGNALVTAAYLQKSTVLSNRRGQLLDGNSFEPNVPLLSSDLALGIHTSSCGHVMHAKCWQNYFEDIQNSERSRSRLRGPQNFNALKHEFLCPLCRTLSNTVIPLIPQCHTLQSLIYSTASSNSPPASDESAMLQDIEDENACSLVLSKGNEVDVTQPIRLNFSSWLDALFIAQKYKKELTNDQTKSHDQEGATGTSAAETSTPTSKSLPTELGGIELDFQRLFQTATDRASRITDRASRIARGLSHSVRGSSTEKYTCNFKTSMMKRFYTCPLDQVVQDLNGMSSVDKSVALSFARLFADAEGQEIVFGDSMHDIIQRFCKSLLRVSKDIVDPPDLNDSREEIEGTAEDAIKVQIDERAIFEAWNTCAFSIHAAVHAELDGAQTTSLVRMSSRNANCVAALVRFCAVMSSNFGEPKVIRSHGLRLLSLLTEIDGLDNPSILDVDAFALLVSLTFSIPSLFNGDHAAHLPLGNVQDQHLLRLVYLVHLVQIMITTDQFSSIQDQQQASNDKYSIVLQVLHQVRDAVGFASENDGSEGLNGQAVWQDLKHASIPFLRSAAVFYYHLSGVPCPTTLEPLAPNEHEQLCKYLGLPMNPKELFADLLERDLARLWSSHPAVQATLAVASSDVRTLSFPLKLNSLVNLPSEYSELMNNVSTFSCPSSSMSDGFRVPAMCLICGEIMCSQSYCCQSVIEGRKEPVGACTAHTRVCGGGVGIFLRIRECSVVLLGGSNKGCFHKPPYVDQYGETDPNLRRGNPLQLCPEKYRKIYKLWLNHQIPQEISHSLEASQNYVINTPWNNL